MQRGCIRDLDGHLKRFCLNQSNTCKTCFENNCNAQTEFRRCYVNEPSSDQIAKLSENYTKICRKFDDKCFSLVCDDGDSENVVIKDCLTDYTEEHDGSIDLITKNNDSSHYKECSETLCNFEKIEPLWCLACDSRKDKNCLDNLDMVTRVKCPLEVTSSGCFHQIGGEHGEHVKRGCLADIEDESERELCELDSDQCKKCLGRECNARRTFQRCITTSVNPERENGSSNTNSNESGESDTTDGNKSKLCKRYTDECFIHVSSDGVVQRGCVSDIIETPIDGIDASDCDDNDDICEKCSLEDDCNRKEITHEQCVVCSSENKKNCANLPVGMLKECPLAVREMGCYLQSDRHDNVERGCVSQLSVEQRADCRAGNGDCKICKSNGCNEKPQFQECFVCDSTIDGPNCLSKPHLFNQQRCRNYLDFCYTQVKDGVVKRNCTGDEVIPDVEQCKEDSENCKYCDNKGGCNEERIKQETCIACTSAENPACATNTIFDTFEDCPLSIQPHNCFHLINEASGEHVRGVVRINIDISMKYSTHEILYCL